MSAKQVLPESVSNRQTLSLQLMAETFMFNFLKRFRKKSMSADEAGKWLFGFVVDDSCSQLFSLPDHLMPQFNASMRKYRIALVLVNLIIHA